MPAALAALVSLAGTVSPNAVTHRVCVNRWREKQPCVNLKRPPTRRKVMTMNSPSWRALALVAGATLLVLTGCTPPAPTPVASPTADSASPTPTPTEEVVSAPAPRIALTCDQLAAALPLGTTFVSAVATRSRAQTEYGAHPSRPEEYVVRSAGGLVCEFSNGAPQSGVRGDNPAYAGVRVLVLPDPGAQWDRYVDYYGAAAAGTPSCATYSGSSNCQLDALVANRWIDVAIDSAVTEAAGAALANAVAAAVTGAGAGAAVWSPPAGTLPLPDDCGAYISGASLQAITGVTVPVESIARYGGGWSLWAGAEVIDGSPSCFLAYLDADAGIGTLKVLRGGEWAWAEAQPLVGSTAITVAGLGADDEAWIRCGAGDAWCVIDMVIGGTWVELYLWEDDFGGAFDQRAAAQAIAAEVLANVLP